MADNHSQVNSALFPSGEPDNTQHAPIPGYRRPVARPSITTSGSRNFHRDWNSQPTTPRTFEYTPDRPSQALPSATEFDTLGNSYSEPPRAGVDPKSKLWEYYNNEARVADKDMLRRWQDDMATLLIFAGLFSGGVLTVFLIEFYTTLQPDYQEISIRQQWLISVNLQALLNATSGAPTYPVFDTTDALSEFRVPRSALWIQGLWFSALVCGISVALLAWLVKSWLLDYVKGMNSGSAYDRAHRRQHRHDALLSWHVPAIIASLPALMHLTVMLFLIGLVILMWQLNRAIGCIMLSMVILLAFIYAVSTLLPLFWPSCPYRNVVLLLLLEMLAPSAQKLVNAVIDLCLKLADWARKHSFTIPQAFDTWLLCQKSHLYNHVRDEQKCIQFTDSELTWRSVIWLLRYSQNTATVDVCLRSITRLKFEPKMIGSLLEADALDLLFSRIDIMLPSSDNSFWRTLTPAPVGCVTSHLSHQYMLSVLHLWMLVSLQYEVSLPLITQVTQNQKYIPLYGDWLYLWRGLREKLSFAELLSNNYNIDDFVTIVCTECLYYHLHPDNHLAINEMQILKQNPVLDLLDLIEKHLTETSIHNHLGQGLDHLTLEIILETLCYSVARVDNHQLIFQDKILSLLFNLIGTLEKEDNYIYNSLALSFTILATNDCNTKREQLLEYQETKQKQTFSDNKELNMKIVTIIRNLLWKHSEMQYTEPDTKLLQLFLQLFKFVLNTTTSPVVDNIFIELPSSYIDALILHICDLDQQWLQFEYLSLNWLINLLVKIYSDIVTSESCRDKIINILGSLAAEQWPDETHNTICSSIFPFLKEQLNKSENAIETCRILQEKLFYTLSQKDRRLLKAFIQFELVDPISTILDNDESNQLGRNWLGFMKLWTSDRQDFVYTDTELLAYQTLYKACQQQNAVVE